MEVTITISKSEVDGYTDYVYPTDEPDFDCDGVDEFRSHTVLQLLHSLIFLLGVAGNGLMITVLLRRWRLLRLTEIYLLHLALADLMLLFTFPFDLVENADRWLFGNFLCKMVGLVRELNVLCCSFLLACIGVDRYLAIVHAITSMQSRRRKTVHITCTILWLVCLALSVPNIAFISVQTSNTNGSFCSFHFYGTHGYNWVLTVRVLEHVCFFLPLAIMSYCYAGVVVTLFKSQRRQAKQGAIRLALLITLIFGFCWLPYNITLVIKTLSDLEVIKHETCSSYGSLQQTLHMTRLLGISHCCLNPFLYAFVGVHFRNELIKLLCKPGCTCACLPFIKPQGHMRPSISEAVTTTSTVFN